jgi:creatinine amidohydrolase
MSTKSRLIEEMDSRTIEKERKGLLIIPVGSIESHGPHLPLKTDLLQAEAAAKELAPKVNALVAPSIVYGVCPGTSTFPGTISIRLSTLSALTEDVLEEFYRLGFRMMLVLSGHGTGAHMAALRDGAGKVVSGHKDLKVAVLCDYDFVYELRGKDSPATDGHGGLLETSRVMALAPELVGPQRPIVQYKGNRYSVSEPKPEEWAESVMGDTTSASEELGRRIQEHVMKRLVETVGQLFP